MFIPSGEASKFGGRLRARAMVVVAGVVAQRSRLVGIVPKRTQHFVINHIFNDISYNRRTKPSNSDHR
jgi:hypothetical protein